MENLEKLASDLEFAQVEMKVLDGLKQGNAALKKVHDMLDINEVEKIMDETREGIEKQQEIDAILTDVLTSEDEEDVLAELDALEAEEDLQQRAKLPEVPSDELPAKEEEEEEEQQAEEEENTAADETKAKIRSKKVLLEA